MPSDKPLQRLNDILENIDWIIQYTRDYGLQEFKEDRRTRDAVRDACYALPNRLESSAVWRRRWPLINRGPTSARSVTSFGTIMIIDPEVIWQIVQDDLLPLEQSLEAAIKKLEQDMGS